MECEEFYIISARYKDGGWNKFAKCYDLAGLNAIPFFWDKEKAENFLNNNIEENIREFYSVFKVTISLDSAEKV